MVDQATLTVITENPNLLPPVPGQKLPELTDKMLESQGFNPEAIQAFNKTIGAEDDTQHQYELLPDNPEIMIQSATKQVPLPVQIRQETAETFVPTNNRYLRPRQAWNELGVKEIPFWQRKNGQWYIPWPCVANGGRIVGNLLKVEDYDALKKNKPRARLISTIFPYNKQSHVAA